MCPPTVGRYRWRRCSCLPGVVNELLIINHLDACTALVTPPGEGAAWTSPRVTPRVGGHLNPSPSSTATESPISWICRRKQCQPMGRSARRANAPRRRCSRAARETPPESEPELIVVQPSITQPQPIPPLHQSSQTGRADGGNLGEGRVVLARAIPFGVCGSAFRVVRHPVAVLLGSGALAANEGMRPFELSSVLGI